MSLTSEIAARYIVMGFHAAQETDNMAEFLHEA